MAYVKFTKDHEWIRVDGAVATVGITNFAQEQLGDIVFVELPEPGTTFGKGDQAGGVESVKAASEIYSPVGGEVLEANDNLIEGPNIVNSEAEGDGWFFKIKISNLDALDDLMDETAYKEFIT